jgi:membrane protease YdiL (CAAX protease family)
VDATNIDFDNFQPRPVGKPVTPNNPPWNGWIAFVAWVMSVLLIFIFPAIFLAPYIMSIKGQFGSSQEMAEFATKDPTALLLQILAIIPAHVATLLLSWFIVTKFRQYSFRDTLGWSMGGMKWWHFVLILLFFFSFAGAVTHFYPEQENDMLRLIQSSRTAVLIVAFMATFTAPLVEEVIYRGLLYSAFQRAVGAIPAIAIVTGMFTLVHVPQYWPSFTTIALLLILSLILTLIRYRTGNLLPCIILHTVFNAFQSILLVIEPYLEQKTAQTDVSVIILKLFQ